MALKKYLKKRNFKITNEPRGSLQQEGGNIYVIQKHAASHLHYDLRLQINATLKSFAVPKGPSTDSTVKRLAVEVEDHPLEYASFEGTIPVGQYGAGTVIVWDTGTWQCVDDPAKAYKKGDITFILKGKKLKGLWKLIRIKTKDKHKNWLFFKLKDKYENKNDILKLKPKSVIDKEVRLTEGKKRKMPATFKPQLCTLKKVAPEGEEWIHEVKLDGYRIIAIVKDKEVRLLSRNGLDWTAKFPVIANELKKIPLKTAIFDGEIVSLDRKGISHFQFLQNHLQDLAQDVNYFIFDLPYCNGYDLSKLPLLERKKNLVEIFKVWNKGHSHIINLDYIQGEGAKIYKEACKFNLEGIVSKNIVSPYEQKRTQSWIKLKCGKQQEFVILGFTKPQRSRPFFGALLLGYYDKKNKLVYNGKTGTGFTHDTLKKMHKSLMKLRQEKPTVELPMGVSHKNITWVKPTLVANVKFTEWTKEGCLRHPSFVGLREDKKAKEVKRELYE